MFVLHNNINVFFICLFLVPAVTKSDRFSPIGSGMYAHLMSNQKIPIDKMKAAPGKLFALPCPALPCPAPPCPVLLV
jgi:hypothetical protein